MKKCILSLAAVFAIMFLTQCHSREDKKLVGVWKLNEMDINGTRISGVSLGGWLWEFNNEGGYLVDIAGKKEKGAYKLEKDQLTVQITTAQNMPRTTYTVSRLDSLQLILTSSADKNKSLLNFSRMKSTGFVDND